MKNESIRRISMAKARARWKIREVARAKKRCPHCRERFDDGDRLPTVDHIVPLSRGGRDEKRNWQLMCKACNRKKGNSMPGDR